VQGLLWFIECVWPLLRAQHPDLRFDIVGKNPDKRLLAAVEESEGIRLTGYVADLQKVYRDSRVSVAPLLFGSGMKVKVLDAMSRGIPTVTTSVGAEGIDIENGRQLLVEDDPVRMAEHIDELLGNPVLWRQLQSESRELIRERYTWQRLLSGMHATIEKNLKSHRRRSADLQAVKAIHAG
jgi:glycosyltransferase involved in cell wall biosynthesis